MARMRHSGGASALDRAMAQRGFRMITLASEAQALRRGAQEHLRDAGGGAAETTKGYN